MDAKEIISMINKSVDQLDFVSARKYIEDNLELVNQNRTLLKSNAREILKFLNDRLDSEQEQLTRKEIAAINTINIYATRFDLRALKLNLVGKEKLLLKKEALNYLNTDAKILLESMGVIKIDG